MIAPPKRDNMFDFPGIALNQHLSSVFLVVPGLYTTCAPTRRPTQAYAACEGRLRDHKSASRCPPTRANVEFKCRSALWQLQLENRNLSGKCSVGSSGSRSKVQHKRESNICPRISTSVLGSGCKKRSTHPKCLESLRECLRGAYAEPTRRLQNKPMPIHMHCKT